MKIIKSIFILLIPIIAHGQTGGTKTGQLGNEDIDIVKDYQPVLNDAFKISIQPDQDTVPPVREVKLNYKIEPIPANSAFNTTPIKPVRIKDETIKKLYRGWVKAGYGLESMPLLDVSFNSLRSKNFDAGVRFQHLSASGKINDYGFPGNSTSSLNAYGTRYFEKFKLDAGLNGQLNKVHFYGFQSPPELYSKSETKHTMTDWSGNISLSSLSQSKEDWRYNAGVDFYTFSDNRNSKENNVSIKAGVEKWMNNSSFQLNASGEFGQIEQSTYSFGRNIVRFNPHFIIKKEDFTVDAGIRATLESNDGENNLGLYPVVRADYQLISEVLRVYGGLEGDLRRNDLRSFSRENPFFGTFIPLVNSNEKINLFAGTSVKLDHDLMLTAEGSLKRVKNMPFFINSYDSLFPTSFSVTYDDVRQLSIKSSIEYRRTEKASVALMAEFNRYSTDQLEKPFYAPRLRTGINATYSIADKIRIKADVFYNNGVYGIEYAKPDTLVTSSVIAINGWLDMNIGVDYRYSKVLSAWLSLNNIGFSRYFRWYEYPSYRFLGMAGITYSF